MDNQSPPSLWFQQDHPASTWLLLLFGSNQPDHPHPHCERSAHVSAI